MVEENVPDVCDWGKVERDQDNVEEVVDLMQSCPDWNGWPVTFDLLMLF